MAKSEFQSAFVELRAILRKHAKTFAVNRDTDNHYGLEAPIGPATLKAWKGKERSKTIPVAWVEIQKSYVSYHLMGVYMNPKALKDCSPELMARMQGKTCFNFKSVDAKLFKELETLTATSLTEMRKAEIISPSS